MSDVEVLEYPTFMAVSKNLETPPVRVADQIWPAVTTGEGVTAVRTMLTV